MGRKPRGKSAPVRILYVEGNSDGTVGGSFFSLLYLIEGLDRTRFEAKVVFARENTLIPRFREAGASVLIRPLATPVVFAGRVGSLFAKAANFFVGFLLEPFRLGMLMRRESIELVHLNNSITRNHPWAVAALMAGLPCVTHERGINKSYSRRSIWLGRRLDAVICISTAVRDSLLSGGATRLRTEVVPNGLDPAVMKPERTRDAVCAELGIDPRKRIVGMVGNIKYWKGQDVMVRALGRLKQRHSDVVCIFVGDSAVGDAEYRRQVEHSVERLGLQSRVAITGYRVRVADYIRAMEVLVHASVEPEPFGRVLLEGMALRKPVVASGDGGVTEIVESGRTGLLFSPGDPVGLAACLDRLLDDRAGAEEMGEAGYQRLLERFGIRRNVEATERIYSRLLGEAEGKPVSVTEPTVSVPRPE